MCTWRKLVSGERGDHPLGGGAGTGPMAGDPLFLMFPTPLCMKYLDLSKNCPFFVYFLKNIYFLIKKIVVKFTIFKYPVQWH